MWIYPTHLRNWLQTTSQIWYTSPCLYGSIENHNFLKAEYLAILAVTPTRILLFVALLTNKYDGKGQKGPDHRA